jgi:hypothetical protein
VKRSSGVILFGGEDGNTGTLSDAWLYHNANWGQFTRPLGRRAGRGPAANHEVLELVVNQTLQGQVELPDRSRRRLAPRGQGVRPPAPRQADHDRPS